MFKKHVENMFYRRIFSTIIMKGLKSDGRHMNKMFSCLPTLHISDKPKD